MEPGTILSVDQSPAMFSEQDAMRNIPYQCTISFLMYAAMSTRLDIAFAIATLLQFMQNLGKVYWEATKRAFRYLKGTAKLELTLGTTVKGLQAFIDADWASQPHRHSMSGYIVLLNGGLVTWSACKQLLIVLSTAEVYSPNKCGVRSTLPSTPSRRAL
jgi:hypothetical protein